MEQYGYTRHKWLLLILTNGADFDRLLHTIAMLQCQAFIFFKLHEPISEVDLVSLHTLSCHIINSAKSMDDTKAFFSIAPAYCKFGVILSAYILLRLLKSPFTKYLNSQVKDCLFTAIGMARSVSRAGGDPADRHATALTQLYNSSRAFKRPDGSDYTILRIRTRLTMSAAFDAIWWWKEEFHGERGAFGDDATTKTSNISTPNTHIMNRGSDCNMTVEPCSTDPTGILDDQLFAEFDWANQLNDDFFAWPSLSMNNGFTGNLEIDTSRP